jgi:hypothetical protein
VRVGAEHLVMQLDHQIEAGLVGDRNQPDPVRQGGAGGAVPSDLFGVGHHERLGVLADEASGEQPFSQVGWLVITVELPLEPLGPAAEERDLVRDDPVGRSGVQLGPGDAGPALTVGRRPADNGADPLPQHAGFIGVQAATHLRVEFRQDRGGIEIHHRR